MVFLRSDNLTQSAVKGAPSDNNLCVSETSPFAAAFNRSLPNSLVKRLDIVT